MQNSTNQKAKSISFDDWLHDLSELNPTQEDVLEKEVQTQLHKPSSGSCIGFSTTQKKTINPLADSLKKVGLI